jgi:hypothetical protein
MKHHFKILHKAVLSHTLRGDKSNTIMENLKYKQSLTNKPEVVHNLREQTDSST